MTREEAIEVYNGLINTKIKEAFEFFAPELAESEDERIRKIITDSVFYQYGAGAEYKDVLDYLDKLEKQKEPHYTKRNALFDECVKNCDPEVMKEVSDKVDEMLGKPSCWDSPVMTHEMIMDEQKEQKPVEIHIDNPNVQKFDPDVKITTSDSSASGKELLYVSNKSYKIGYRDGVASVNPTEWSEEDNIGWDEAFACVIRAEITAENGEVLQNAVTAEKWLKEIKFKYYVHPVKQEWSEDFDKEVENIHKRYPEVSFAKLTRIAYHFSKWANRHKDMEWSEKDEEMRLEAIRVLVSGCERYRRESGRLPNWHKTIDWLKSLRPSWKPSEEQMKALQNAVALAAGNKALAGLYEHLKKL